MYQEWMDAVPTIVEGCYENNIQQAQLAVNWHEEHGFRESADYWREYIKEQTKLKQEEDSLTVFGKIVKRIMYKKEGQDV